MPTMQNKTVKAAAVTWNDSRLHSTGGPALAAREFADSPASCMCGVRIGAVTLVLVCVSNIERENTALDKLRHAKDSWSRSRGTSHFNGFEFAKRCIRQRQKEKTMSATRRELFSMLPVVLIPSILQEAGTAAKEDAMPSAAYPFENLPVRTTKEAQIRAVLKGKLATGESLEVHETTLPPGGMPHPPHHHVHSEMWLVRGGTVELTINGTSSRFGPGSVGFVHSNDEHGIKKVGDTPATYFVVAVGPRAGLTRP